jgi:PPOX class probable F420-dependent enzyme
MELVTALGWASLRKHAVLITIRSDGRPQSSDIAYGLQGESFLISLTATRAKTVNIRRDPRVVLHLSDPSRWTYLAFDGIVSLSAVATRVDDEVVDQLVAYYEQVAGTPHPNWDEYRQAMVDEQRLIATFTPTSVVGQIN